MRKSLILPLILSLASTARAELSPDEVAIVAMAQSQQSRQLAEYYASARGVPKSQILLLDGKPSETIARDTWDREVRPAIYAWLMKNGLRDKVRCLVTTWDVPLKIGRRADDSAVVVERKEFLARSRQRSVEQLAEMLKSLDAQIPGGEPSERPELTAETALPELTAQIDAVMKSAMERTKAIVSEEDKKLANGVLERGVTATGGLAGLLSVVARSETQAELNPEISMRIERAKGQVEGLNAGLQAVGSMSDSVVRDLRALALLRQSHGLLGSLQWIDRQIQVLEKNETNSSFDSELSLVYWSDYPLLEWLPNLLHYRYGDTPTGSPPTLMVARLEAPTLELAKKLIDAAIATEKQGLTGKVYLDARGMKFDPKKERAGSYGEYDQSLRDLAERLSKHTKLQVVLNDEAKLFQAGECPEAALYCGWYSLAKYVDAFDWRPGAVGYHMASSEAATLRKPGGAVWCNAMLEDGVAATLGPVQEPYLSAFPLPDDFFSLLLTGRYTLVETYYRTNPYNSWVMVLVGDPLYNPFKNSPQLSDDALPERMKRPGAGAAVSAELPPGEESKP